MFHGMHNPGASYGKDVSLARKQLYIGNRNANSIAAGSGRTLAMDIVQNVGQPMIITGFALRYATGLESALIQMFDAYHNREIITGNVQFCTVGHLETAAAALPFIRVAPFELITGQSVQVFVTNESGTAAPAGGIAVTLEGFQN